MVLLVVPTLSGPKPILSPLPKLLLFFALFVVAAFTTLIFEVRSHRFVVAVAEIPLVLALFYLSPISMVMIRLIAYTLTAIRERQALPKLFFNLANIGTSCAAAGLIVSMLGLDGAGPRSWLVLLVAAGASVVSVAIGIIAVVSVVEGGVSFRRVARTLTPAVAVGWINAMIGLLVLLVIQRSAWAVLLVLGLAGVLFLVYRSYAQFLRQHKSLTEIYDLTQAIEQTRSDGTLIDVLLGRVRSLLQAEWATLWLAPQGRYPENLLSARMDDRGLIDLSKTPAEVRSRVKESGESLIVGPRTGDPVLRSALREAGIKDVISVPLRSGSVVIGTLEVVNRAGDLNAFDASDVRLLETVATHAAVAVENARLVDRLRFDAQHDALTGLPNRRRMLAALEEAVKVRAPGEVVAVMEFDVSGLRDVNDSLGHAAGDTLLSEVARRLRAAAAPAALVARIGGDEFVLTMRVADADAALDVAAGLRVALQGPMEIGSLTLDVDTAVGVAVHPDHGSEPATLLQRAEVATHAAKSIPAALQLFNPGLESRSARRLGLAGDLRRALDNNELQVYFQPKVSLHTRRLVGVECLARWEHAAHGSVSPEDFVAVAEHTGQLGRLTDVVLREGLRRCQEWAAAGRPLNVAVNLSPRTLMDPAFPGRVAELLGESGVPPSQLTLEVTEAGVISEADRPLPTLRRLYDLGVRLAVDDFGTGYSSLAHLRRLPVHEVKIDRTFVQGMATDSGDLAIVKAVVDLSRHFGLSVVAEGVESELTLSLLEDIGCDLGQGFLFSRPLPHDRLEAWFAAQTEPEPTSMGEVRRLRAVL
jgi:diguanylate cyclase (GGDEF)-like protein